MLQDSQEQNSISIVSFSYELGPLSVPVNTMLYSFDCRCIRDPMYTSFAHCTGADAELAAHLDTQPTMMQFMGQIDAFISFVIFEMKQTQNTRDLVIAFGCTHGRHRSVYCANKLASILIDRLRVQVQCRHRDLV